MEWTPEMDVTLFQAVVRYKPVGVHKHFRMVNVQRFFNTNMGTALSAQDIWSRLSRYYDLAQLDILADSNSNGGIAVKDEQGDASTASPSEEPVVVSRRDSNASLDCWPPSPASLFRKTRNFELPMDEFDDLIEEQRKADVSSEYTPDGSTTNELTKLTSNAMISKHQTVGRLLSKESPETIRTTSDMDDDDDTQSIATTTTAIEYMEDIKKESKLSPKRQAKQSVSKKPSARTSSRTASSVKRRR